MDGIICDYNYVFDPNVKLKRYFDQGEPGQGYLFLVDEAHNLVARAREMYSASLVKEDVLLVRRILKSQTGAGKVLTQLDKLNQKFLDLKRSYGSEDAEGIIHRQVLGSDYELLPDVNLLASTTKNCSAAARRNTRSMPGPRSLRKTAWCWLPAM